MIIVKNKEVTLENRKALRVKAERGCTLVVKATDCDIVTDLSRIIITCNEFSVKERKSKKNEL